MLRSFKWKAAYIFLQPYWALHFLPFSFLLVLRLLSLVWTLLLAIQCINQTYLGNAHNPRNLLAAFLLCVCDSSLLFWLIDALQFSVKVQWNMHILRKALLFLWLHFSATFEWLNILVQWYVSVKMLQAGTSVLKYFIQLLK